VWWSYNGFHDDIRFISVSLSSKCGVCSKWTSNLAHATFFFSSLLFYFKANHAKNKSGLSLYYFFIFGSCSFYYYLFYLRWFMKLDFLISSRFIFFYLSNLVLIFLIDIFLFEIIFNNFFFFTIS